MYKYYISDLLSFGLDIVITGDVIDECILCQIRKGINESHGVLLISEGIPYGVELYNISEVRKLLDMLDDSDKKKHRLLIVFKLFCRKLLKHAGFYLIESMILIGLLVGQIFVCISIIDGMFYHRKRYFFILYFLLLLFSTLVIKGFMIVIFCMRTYGIDKDYWKSCLEHLEKK